MNDNNPIRIVETFTVQVTGKVEAEVSGRITFTADDVREWAGLSESEEVDAATIEEYAQENIDDSFVDLDDIDYWRSSDATVLERKSERVVPACFVPLFDEEMNR